MNHVAKANADSWFSLVDHIIGPRSQFGSTDEGDSARVKGISRTYGGVETYLKAAMEKKKVPLQIMNDKAQADFIITGHSESEKASTAKKAILWNFHSNEDASINVSSVRTGEVGFAYEAHKDSSAHGQQSTAEACAKHLKDKVEGK